MEKLIYTKTLQTLQKLVKKNDFLTNYRLSENIIIDSKMQENLEPLDFYLLVRELDNKGISFNKRKTKDGKNLDAFMLGILNFNIGLLLGIIECSDSIEIEIDKNNLLKNIKNLEEESIYLDKLSDYTLSNMDRISFMILNMEELCIQLLNKPTRENIIDYFIAINNKNKGKLKEEDIENIYNFLDFFEYLEIFKEEYKKENKKEECGKN